MIFITLDPKTSSSSAVTLAQSVLPAITNPSGNMHGGEVMKMMDGAAGVVAARHSHNIIVTANVSQISFMEPIFLGDLVICNAHITYTGRSSMEIYVKVKAEDTINGTVKNVSEGYFMMVALDRNGRPTEVPPLLIENEAEQKAFDDAKIRIQQMKKLHQGM